MDVRSLSVFAAGVLALAGGCVTPEVKKVEAKKPDVTQPGVLPPPQETTRPAGSAGGVVPVSADVPAGDRPAAAARGPAVPKLSGLTERKLVATEMAVSWRSQIAHLPDPAHSGRMSPGLAGQMFLFGGPKLEFVLADGTLTVDLVDETPRPPGQPAATPERWQFDKATLRNLQTSNETFGKSYVLFLPWPAYKPDVTKVKISARYDPDSGYPLFVTPSVITIDTTTPFGATVRETTAGNPAANPAAFRPQPFATPSPAALPPGLSGAPIPLSGAPAPGLLPPPGAALTPMPGAMLPMPGVAPGGAGLMPMVPTPGVTPGAPNLPPDTGFEPLTVTLPGPRR